MTNQTNFDNQNTQQIVQNQESKPVITPEKTKSNFLLIGVLIMVCFVVFGFGGYYLAKQSSDGNNIDKSQIEIKTTPLTTTELDGGIRFDNLNDYATSDASKRSILSLRSHDYLPVQSDFLTKAYFDVDISYYKQAKYYELATFVDNFEIYIQYVFLDYFTETMPEEYRGTFLGYENYGNKLISDFPIPEKQKEVVDSDNRIPFYWTNRGGQKSFETPSFCNFSDYVNLFDGNKKSTFTLIKVCYPYSKIPSFDENKFNNERSLPPTEFINGKGIGEENSNFTWISSEDERVLRQKMKIISNSFSFSRALVN